MMLRAVVAVVILLAAACSGPQVERNIVAPVRTLSRFTATVGASQTITTPCGDITVSRQAAGANGHEEIVISRAGGGATAIVTRHVQRVGAKWQPAATSRFSPIAELHAQEPTTNVCRVSSETEQASPFLPGPLFDSFLQMEKSGWITPAMVQAAAGVAAPAGAGAGIVAGSVFKKKGPTTPLLRMQAVTDLSSLRKIRFVPIIGERLSAAQKDDACTAAVMLSLAVGQILEIQTGVVLEILPPQKFARTFARTDDDYAALKKLADSNPQAPYDLAHLIEQHTDLSAAVGEAAVGGACGNDRAKAYSVIPKGSPEHGVNIMVHEVLHQLNARHSHVNSKDPKTAASQFEPGNGTSVMSWDMRDRYLHAATVDQVAGFLAANASCGEPVIATPAQTPKIANAGMSYSVPAGTPFELTTDGNPFSCVRWHEWDPATTKGLPWFRSFESCSPVRMLPSPPALRRPEPGDQVITARQTMRFVAIVNSGRDEVAAGLIRVSVRASPQPFAITNADTSCATSAQHCVKVTWQGAMTKSSDSVKNVVLEGSKDNGRTWVGMGVSANSDSASTRPFPFDVPQLCGGDVDLRLKAVGGVIVAMAPTPIRVC